MNATTDKITNNFYFDVAIGSYIHVQETLRQAGFTSPMLINNTMT